MRVAKDSSDDDSEYYQVTDRSSSSASVIDYGDGGDIISSDEDGDASMDGESTERRAQAQMSRVSFGALAKAQDALEQEHLMSRKRKRGDDTSQSQDEKLEALRARLRQIKAERLTNPDHSSTKTKRSTKIKAMEDVHASDNDGSGEEDLSASDSDGRPMTRSSKHAPAVQSSKRMVSRKRNVVDVKKPVFRDPRFDNVSGPRPDENTIGKRYAFLYDYRASEIAELRQAIKKSKNEGEKERLRKKLLSMESQEKARENKEKQQEVIREHRKKEKELVKQGKQPFYLKKCMSFSSPLFSLGEVFLEGLTVCCSRAKEDCLDRPIPEHEVEAA